MRICFFTKPRSLALISALALCCLPVLAYSQTESTPTLHEITVIAAAEPDTLKNTPANVQVINQNEISRTGANTISQLLERSSAVHSLIQPGSYSRVYIRGFSTGKAAGNTFSDQVLLLIDGNRTGTGNLDHIPLHTIERVEILRGPAAILYGGSAVGGVINIINKKGKGPLKAQIGAEGGSFDHFAANAGLSSGLADDKFGFSIAAQTDSANDYDTGKGRYKNSGYNRSGGGATLSWRPEEDTTVSGVFAMQEVYDTGSPGDIYWSTPHSKTSNSWGYGALELDTRLDNDITIKTSLYGNQNVYRDDNREAFPYDSRFTSRTFGARIVNGIPLPELGVADLGRLAIGAEYMLHKQTLGGSSVSEPESETDVYALFAQHKFSPLPSLTMQYGLRYDRYENETKKSDKLNMQSGSDDFDQITWSGGATWWMFDWLGLRSSVGTAYVPPSSMQLAGEYSSWGSTYKGNPDLKAEKAITWDVGLDFEKYGLYGTVGYFQTRYKDRISTRLLSASPNIFEYVNQGRQNISGLEANLRYSSTVNLGGHKMTVSPYSNWEYLTKYENSGDNKETDKIKDIPRYTGLLGLGLGLDPEKIWGLKSVWLDFNAQFVGNHYGYDFATYEYRTFSSFVLYNARLSVNPIDNFSVYLDVRNLEDKYYGYKDEFPMPGRTVNLGFKYEY